ncbi:MULTISPECIES: hypothetical protein [unclassified Sulfuricurvum]|uniref:hypothetical protein n=1 Tax=unclassified Sulfuricurvum TaxID=2632390 RepID=UPI0002995F9B|nr:MULTISPECIES: hypothetical protein [unclassified Sulfuricurvum]OHD82565.1 MAG: hypothetical protein A3D90_08365 [Sulfuricurvum sp. RIFCSPHIGHO2_02_FULL_43_9]OHD84395.1 MAG: hypothetical protein A3J39_10635 [Sulfuricurvum sp. RIFCSPHIGHO2_12_FULL_44_8]OHD85213.1 MAG: hypothetical protein A3I60_01550 [Sulfuricurvum sp. RIFCSPLOWO2_02_FULL_43_45]AFV97645.1 hypothetical protein B649_06655 [Candidatus Sulfuricurvum sp. RIFRC-1]HBM36861.1 hypothetical protein [Sulfuricurvum sp.]
MRPYRNISDSELESFGAIREWDSHTARSITAPASVLWVHSAREKFHRLDPMNSCLVKTLTIERIQGDVIKTNFGSYSLETGKNIFYACGCKKFCDCYGQLYLLKDDTANRHSAQSVGEVSASTFAHCF